MSAPSFGSECIVINRLPLTHDGYPVLCFGKNGSQKSLAARLAYRLFVGEVMHWQVVSHRCGNKSCINPSHLYVRDRRDASSDRADRRCTSEDVWYIRHSTLSLGQLKEKFGFDTGYFSRVRSGEVGRNERFSFRYALLILWERVTRKGRRR